jgi:hypothetical protein
MLFFIVYNDGSHTEQILKLLESVKEYGKEFEIIVFNRSDIDNEYYIRYNYILSLPRGGGYWLWKPILINKILKIVNENDIIFYLDSQYYFTENFTNLYQEYMQNNDILIWKNKPNCPVYFMKNFCKMDVIKKYNLYDKVFKENLEDCWAGAIIIKKTQNTIKYMKEWLDMCCVYEDITDSASIEKNDQQYREHRHDQSLLSIVMNKYNIKKQYFPRKYLQNVRDPY